MPFRAFPMRKAAALGLSLAALGAACLETASSASTVIRQKSPTVSFVSDVKPMLAKYCAGCHSGKDATAGLDVTKLSAADLMDDSDIWNRVVDRLSKDEMPPKGMPQPVAMAKTRALTWIKNALDKECRIADPGRVTIRRLNREEYNNTVRDLMGVNFHPADDFPSDDVGYGFDNIGDVLSVSPLLMEKYLSAAEKIAHKVIQVPGVKTLHIESGDMSGGANSSQRDDGWRAFYSEGAMEKAVDFPAGGHYRLRIRAAGDLAGPELPKMEVKVDGKVFQVFEVGVKFPNATVVEAPIDLDSGTHKISVAFTNDYYNTKDPPGKQDRNLYVNFVEFVGPTGAQAPMSPAYLHIIPTQPTPDTVQPDARRDIKNFATRAFRRPVTTQELDRLMTVFNVGLKDGSFSSGMQIAVEAVLASPNFLFRAELDPKGSKAGVRTLDDYELATRLSYFLWSSMPDDELFQLAAEGKLHKDAVLKQQVERMLADSKANALAKNFAGQWLQLRKLSIIFPDPQRFPGVDDAMKKNMATETETYFMYVLQNNRPITDFIDSNYTFVNQKLAEFYGMQGVTGDQFQKVPVEEPRGGVLTQASVLTVTSNPTRTSPTKRGKWVLEQILNAPPPPPPPGVGTIADEPKKLSATSLRQLMEEHRKNPMCAACHAKMDPIGFGMENFDAVGKWRTKDGQFTLDTTGVLPDGRSFSGPMELKQILLKDKAKFARAMAEKLLTYGLGRGVEGADKCSVDAIVQSSATSGYRFEDLVTQVVESDPFRKTRLSTAQ